MQYKITIPEPCRQNWDNMIPDETGRYCNSCKKSVIDFTEKTDEEIQQFIANNINQSLCGRFKNSQVERIVIDLPQNIFSIQMPLWMRFLVACLLIFGISIFPFETTIAGRNPETSGFYQGGPKITTEKVPFLRIKKKKKYRHRLNITSLRSVPLNIEMEVLGGLGIQSHDNPIVKSIIDLPENRFSEIVFNAVTKEPDQEKKPIPHKEQPHPAPYMPTEFILPALLSIRKETNDPSMD